MCVLSVLEQRLEVVEGIGAGQFGGVDQRHEEVADFGAVLGLVEQ